MYNASPPGVGRAEHEKLRENPWSRYPTKRRKRHKQRERDNPWYVRGLSELEASCFYIGKMGVSIHNLKTKSL